MRNSRENLFEDAKKRFIKAKHQRDLAFTFYADILRAIQGLFPFLGHPLIAEAAHSEYDKLLAWLNKGNPAMNFEFSPLLLTDTYQDIKPVRQKLIEADKECRAATAIVNAFLKSGMTL